MIEKETISFQQFLSRKLPIQKCGKNNCVNSISFAISDLGVNSEYEGGVNPVLLEYQKTVHLTF